jgi:hypothetical protein
VPRRFKDVGVLLFHLTNFLTSHPGDEKSRGKTRRELKKALE